MLKIDSHQHFWKFNAARDSWMTDEMSAIRKDFLPEHLQPLLQKHDFDGCVVVQSDNDNVFQLSNAENYDFVKGVVGWVELQDDKIEDQLEYYRKFEKMKGFRYILQNATDRAMMLKPEFKRGIDKLGKYGYTYDILIYPDQLAYTKELVSAHPNQLFVIDHMAKPYIKDKKIDDWKKDINALGQYQNLFCKVSGLVTEADWKAWQKDDFRPYLDVVIEAFGSKRIMFGSDWPVCLLASTYEETIALLKDYFSSFSLDEQALFFGGNAVDFYHLS